MILVEILRANMDSYFVHRFTIGMYVINLARPNMTATICLAVGGYTEIL